MATIEVLAQELWRSFCPAHSGLVCSFNKEKWSPIEGRGVSVCAGEGGNRHSMIFLCNARKIGRNKEFRTIFRVLKTAVALNK